MALPQVTVSAPLYARVMGEAWTRVAEPIRLAHIADPIVRARGHFRIEHGSHPCARFCARVLRLPDPGAAAETRLVVTASSGGEQWLRTFAGRHLETRQYLSGMSELAERFGLLELRFRLDAVDGSLVYEQLSAALVFGPLRVRIPVWWAPRVEAREDPAGPKRTVVTVRVILPFIGPLISYGGTIELEDPT